MQLESSDINALAANTSSLQQEPSLIPGNTHLGVDRILFEYFSLCQSKCRFMEWSCADCKTASSRTGLDLRRLLQECRTQQPPPRPGRPLQMGCGLNPCDTATQGVHGLYGQFQVYKKVVQIQENYQQSPGTVEKLPGHTPGNH